MNILFDTSVLVAAMVEAHPMHERALPWLQRVQSGLDFGIIATHSIAELYAILTTLPIHPRISPRVALQLIQQNVLSVCETIALSDEDYKAVLDKFSNLIEKLKGVMIKVEEWGKQKLAYKVKKFDKGSYVLFDYCGESGLTAEFGRDLKLDDRVIKFQTVKLADTVDPEELLQKEQEAKRKNQR